MSTKIILQRHAQSIGNRDKIYLGHTDLGLTEEGIKQAKIAAEYLKNEKIDAIYSSDLIRAYETALPHAQMRSLTVTKCENLREIFVGDWEGGDVNELNKLTEFTVDRFLWSFKYPNGEASIDAAKRLKSELSRIASQHDGQTVLIVSHGAAIRDFWYLITNSSTPSVIESVPFIINTGYCVISYSKGEFIPEEYNVSDFVPKTDVKPV